MKSIWRCLLDMVALPLIAGAVIVALVFWGASCAGAAPWDAEVRITSHGASGTVISSSPGRSLILSCAHMFLDERGVRPDPALLSKKLVIDGHAPVNTGPWGIVARVVKVDYARDLSLIELSCELPYVTPVSRVQAAQRNVLSTGFDKMTWPVTVRRATLTRCQGDQCNTAEAPIPGRSGGGLLDADSGTLIGVCTGFEVVNRRPGQGIYVSLAAITTFLGGGAPPTRQGAPWVQEIREPGPPSPGKL